MNESVLNARTRIQRNPEMVHSSIDGEVVMMSVEQGEYYGLNPMASRIWNLLEEPRSVGEVCQSLRESFDVSEAQCAEEVARFLGEIAESKLITLTDSALSPGFGKDKR